MIKKRLIKKYHKMFCPNNEKYDLDEFTWLVANLTAKQITCIFYLLNKPIYWWKYSKKEMEKRYDL